MEEQLETVMFAGETDARDKARRVRRRLTDYRRNKTHNRHIHLEDCEEIGLRVEKLEEKGQDLLQDLVLTVHHCYMHSLMNTGTYKMIENHEGVGFMKQLAIQQITFPQQSPQT